MYMDELYIDAILMFLIFRGYSAIDPVGARNSDEQCITSDDSGGLNPLVIPLVVLLVAITTYT